MKIRHLAIGICFIAALMVVSGCRGYRTSNEPIHLNPNLDWQARFGAQQLSQQPPENTVPWGTEDRFSNLNDNHQIGSQNTEFFKGKKNGVWVSTPPIVVTKALIERGQERYNIYCAVCHDKAGTGKGTVISRGYIPPPNISDDRIVAYKDGELFDIISNGIRNMPGYKKQIPEKDRWAIVTYVRALQKSRNARWSDLTPSQKEALRNRN